MDMMAFLFAFCGGAFAAIIGSLAAFILCGVMALLGVISAMAGVQFDWFALIPFGIFFGPHISFAGGAAAAAFAKKKGYLGSGKDIAKALISLKKPSVIVAGGIYGCLGYAINVGLSTVMAGKIDTVAFTIVILGLLTKFLYDADYKLSGLIGTVPAAIKKAGGRYSIRSNGTWLPYLHTPAEKTIVGLAAGGASAYVTYAMLQNPATAPVAAYVGFGVAVVSLIFLQFGTAIPVTHHMCLVASYATVASGSLWWGVAFGVIAAFLADALGKTFYVFGDCHVDCPSMGIAAGSFLALGIMPLTGLYTMSTLVLPLGITAAIILYSFIQYKRYGSAVGVDLPQTEANIAA